MTYEKVIKFDYTDTEEWKGWIVKNLIPPYSLIKNVLDEREQIKKLYDNESLYDAIKVNKKFNQIFLGGINKDGKYNSKSMAKLCKDVLGISPNQEWINRYRIKGIDAYKDFKCDFSITSYIQFFERFKEEIDKLITLAGIDRSIINEDKIQNLEEFDPNKVVSKLARIHSDIINISAICDYHTFFILNTRCIPIYYLELAYPNFKEKMEIKNFLGIEKIYIPESDDEELINKYTLWGHKEGGIADLIYELNYNGWQYYNDKINIVKEYISQPSKIMEKILYSPIVSDRRSYLSGAYYDMVKQFLPNKNSMFNLTKSHYWNNNYDCLYYISGSNLKSYKIWYDKSPNNSCNIPFFNLLDELSPELFFGISVIDIRYLKENILKISSMRGDYGSRS